MTEPRPDEHADLDMHEVRPVDQARVARWLRNAGMRYFVNHQGPIGGIWSGCMFTFGIAGRGGVLQIRGQYNRVVAIERREEIIALLNERHARSAWPKCFLMVLDDGSMRIAADHSVSIAHGLSELQLERAIKTGLSAALTTFAEITARYPDPLATAPEGQP
ncbi:YbjN domain-containing protein [Pseudactinotalea suaedae]|uniref:YbjN domain-containing protein n=1 Tax=Pseudactinotalea suaedae TaxID=1524924 RepID=UPI0012E29DDF|nr:YbjN domain-containing protein [Pseudactinotalea suaedae]